MKTIVYDTPRVLAWMILRMKYPVSWPAAQAIGIARDGKLVGGVAFEGFGLADVNLHIVSEGKHWLTHEFLVHCFSYPFVQLGLRRVTGLIPASNHKSLRFAAKLGFKVEGIARHALPDDDIVIHGMLKEECRYIPQR